MNLNGQATGSGTITYQWYKNGLAIIGATLSTFSITCVVPTDAGSYTVKASNSLGSTMNSPYQVTVQSSTGSVRLINTSTLINVGTGSNVLTTGLVLTGSGQKSYLIRAIGPSLTSFGVNGILTNPTLTVFNNTGAAIASNDNWDASLSTAMSAAGAFALTPSSLDAAIVISLGPGSYTCRVSGVGNTTGIALLEVYELP